MTVLTWDSIGERRFETGLDRGVLYLSDGSGVVWNGLTSVEEDKSDVDISPYFFDGLKYNETRYEGDFSATIRAYTYPDEFLQFDGITEIETGYYITGQQVQSRFGLSYRTKSGNALDGVDAHYKIHILYSLIAQPDNVSYGTLTDSVDISDFGWKVTGIPEPLSGYKPSVHFVFDSRLMVSEELMELEQVLYGTSSTEPTLPPMQDLFDYITSWQAFHIVDNGDDTWTATGSSFRVRDHGDTFELFADQAVVIDDESIQLTTI